MSVVSSGDDEPYISMAKEQIIGAIVANQSASVSAVSGATFSSNGIINAAASAIAQAQN